MYLLNKRAAETVPSDRLATGNSAVKCNARACEGRVWWARIRLRNTDRIFITLGKKTKDKVRMKLEGWKLEKNTMSSCEKRQIGFFFSGSEALLWHFDGQDSWESRLVSWIDNCGAWWIGQQLIRDYVISSWQMRKEKRTTFLNKLLLLHCCG